MSTLRRSLPRAAALVLTAVAVAAAHDMFLRPRSFFAAPGARYAKNVKALPQVGDARTSAFATVLGHPAELVPLENPYALRAGATLRVRALVDGSPVANQVVLVGGVASDGTRIAETSVRTAQDGIAAVRLSKAGDRYVKFINMVRVTGDPAIDYRAKWATLTFGAR